MVGWGLRDPDRTWSGPGPGLDQAHECEYLRGNAALHFDAMPEVRPPALVVIQVAPPADERFVIVEAPSIGFRPFAQPGGTMDRLEAMRHALMSLPTFTEGEVRTRLAARGDAPEDIERHLERARTWRLPSRDALPSIEMETITRIGYRNPEGQEVTRKTAQVGPGHQRVFVMRCQVCGHEYGAYGCDIGIRRCPACQDGPPGIALPAR